MKFWVAIFLCVVVGLVLVYTPSLKVTNPSGRVMYYGPFITGTYTVDEDVALKITKTDANHYRLQFFDPKQKIDLFGETIENKGKGHYAVPMGIVDYDLKE